MFYERAKSPEHIIGAERAKWKDNFKYQERAMTQNHIIEYERAINCDNIKERERIFYLRKKL